MGTRSSRLRHHMTSQDPTKRKTYTLSLDPLLMKDIKHLAVDEDKNVNEIVEEAMRDILKKRKNPKGK
jgi:hypothetical protein